MYTTSGYSRNSTITDVESVSYVSSPWIPQLFRRSGRETTDNAGLVGILETATSNIKDELNEVVNLDELKVFFGEWIPMGANQIVALNDRLGSSERVQVRQKHHVRVVQKQQSLRNGLTPAVSWSPTRREAYSLQQWI